MTERSTSSFVSSLRRRWDRTTSFGPPEDVADIAERFALEPVGDVGPEARAFPSMILGGASLNVLRHDGAPFVEFGNHGAPLVFGRDSRPSKRGYIAIRHGLPLPHVFIRSCASGQFTVTELAQLILEVTPNDAGIADEPKTVTAFQRASIKLDHSPGLGKGFHLFCSAEDEATADSMVTGPALEKLTLLGESFDMEIVDGWLIACNIWGDVVTRDDEAWRWVFAATSRLLDLLAGWAPLVPGTDECSLAGRASLPFYTAALVERPKKLRYRHAPDQG